MPALLIYLLKVNVALLLFCLCYYTILRPLTFYTLNRIYLVKAILFSSVYPLIDFTWLFARHEKLVQPLQGVVLEITLQTKPIAQTNYWNWSIFIFWMGFVLMAMRLVIQFISLWKMHRRSKVAHIQHYKIREISEEVNPFSFWQSIYINPKQHAPGELPAVIAHEQVHVSQWHTLDILLAEFSLVYYWFNPGVWLIKRAVTENLEFITDRKILQQGVNAKSYQYSLLYASINTPHNTLVNHFNISTIKKRIMMMNSKKSSAFSLTRYGLIAPAILVLLLTFGTSSRAALLKKGISSAKNITARVLNMAHLNVSTPVIASVSGKPVAKPSNSTRLTVLTTQRAVTPALDTTLKISKLSAVTDTPKYYIATKQQLSDSLYYLINGSPSTSAQLTLLNPKDILSMHVIKAPHAEKLYGEKASKGVIIVTTKDGENTEAAKQVLEKVQGFNFNSAKAGQEPHIFLSKTKNGAITITGKADSGTKKLTTTDNANRVLTGNAVNGGNRKLFITTNGSRKDSLNDVIVIGSSTKTDGIKNLRIKGNVTPGKASPLILIDGKEATNEEMKSIDPGKIERVEVYKDKASLKPYGKKGANGVVVIVTKQGAVKP
jgi:bla regulator protein BlaR1